MNGLLNEERTFCFRIYFLPAGEYTQFALTLNHRIYNTTTGDSTLPEFIRSICICLSEKHETGRLGLLEWFSSFFNIFSTEKLGSKTFITTLKKIKMALFYLHKAHNSNSSNLVLEPLLALSCCCCCRGCPCMQLNASSSCLWLHIYFTVAGQQHLSTTTAGEAHTDRVLS